MNEITRLYMFLLELLMDTFIGETSTDSQKQARVYLLWQMRYLNNGEKGSSIHDNFCPLTTCNEEEVRRVFLDVCRAEMSYLNGRTNVPSFDFWNYVHDMVSIKYPEYKVPEFARKLDENNEADKIGSIIDGLRADKRPAPTVASITERKRIPAGDNVFDYDLFNTGVGIDDEITAMTPYSIKNGIFYIHDSKTGRSWDICIPRSA